MRSLNGAEKIYATNGTEQLYVTYRCNKGLRFHDGLSEKTFFCSHHNNIDISSLDCAGKKKRPVFHIFDRNHLLYVLKHIR